MTRETDPRGRTQRLPTTTDLRISFAFGLALAFAMVLAAPGAFGGVFGLAFETDYLGFSLGLSLGFGLIVIIRSSPFHQDSEDNREGKQAREIQE